MSSSITRVESENERLKNRLKNANRSQQERGQQIQSLAVKGVTAYSMKGFDLESKLAIAGFDGLTVAAVGGLLASEFLDGDLANVAGDIGEAAAIIKAYELGREAAGADAGA